MNLWLRNVLMLDSPPHVDDPEVVEQDLTYLLYVVTEVFITKDLQHKVLRVWKQREKQTRGKHPHQQGADLNVALQLGV